MANQNNVRVFVDLSYWVSTKTKVLYLIRKEPGNTAEDVMLDIVDKFLASYDIDVSDLVLFIGDSLVPLWEDDTIFRENDLLVLQSSKLLCGDKNDKDRPSKKRPRSEVAEVPTHQDENPLAIESSHERKKRRKKEKKAKTLKSCSNHKGTEEADSESKADSRRPDDVNAQKQEQASGINEQTLLSNTLSAECLTENIATEPKEQTITNEFASESVVTESKEPNSQMHKNDHSNKGGPGKAKLRKLSIGFCLQALRSNTEHNEKTENLVAPIDSLAGQLSNSKEEPRSLSGVTIAGQISNVKELPAERSPQNVSENNHQCTVVESTNSAVNECGDYTTKFSPESTLNPNKENQIWNEIPPNDGRDSSDNEELETSDLTGKKRQRRRKRKRTRKRKAPPPLTPFAARSVEEQSPAVNTSFGIAAENQLLLSNTVSPFDDGIVKITRVSDGAAKSNVNKNHVTFDSDSEVDVTSDKLHDQTNAKKHKVEVLSTDRGFIRLQSDQQNNGTVEKTKSPEAKMDHTTAENTAFNGLGSSHNAFSGYVNQTIEITTAADSNKELDYSYQYAAVQNHVPGHNTVVSDTNYSISVNKTPALDSSNAKNASSCDTKQQNQGLSSGAGVAVYDLVPSKAQRHLNGNKEFQKIAGAQVFNRRNNKKRSNFPMSEAVALSGQDQYSNKSFVFQNSDDEEKQRKHRDQNSESRTAADQSDQCSDDKKSATASNSFDDKTNGHQAAVSIGNHGRQAFGFGNQGNRQAVVKDYGALPALHGAPREGDRIAYKVLEMGQDYSPGLSDYKEAKVLRYDPVQRDLTLELITCKRPTRSGRFYCELEDEEEVLTVQHEKVGMLVELPLASLVEPKLVS